MKILGLLKQAARIDILRVFLYFVTLVIAVAAGVSVAGSSGHWIVGLLAFFVVAVVCQFAVHMILGKL